MRGAVIVNGKRIIRREFVIKAGLGMAAAVMGIPIISSSAAIPPEDALALLGGFTWIKQAGFRIQDRDKIIYLDPYQVQGSPHDADLIFVTHAHGDHCDTSSISAVVNEETQIVTEPESENKLKNLSSNITTVKPGDRIAIDDVGIKAVPAYNISKSFHPKSKNWLGFVLTLSDGRRVYHAGDTDHIPEMVDIETDIALLPVGGTYTMTSAEAVEAAKVIQPKVAVPKHYGAVVGSVIDAESFKENLEATIASVIFDEGQTILPAVLNAKHWKLQ